MAGLNLKCIKCGKSELDFQQDSRGCETFKIFDETGLTSNNAFICSECISQFDSVKDEKGRNSQMFKTLADLKYLLDDADRINSPQEKITNY